MFSNSCMALSADPMMLGWTRTGQEELSGEAMQASSITTCHLPLPDLCRTPAETQSYSQSSQSPGKHCPEEALLMEVSLGPSLPSNRATGDGLAEPDQGQGLILSLVASSLHISSRVSLCKPSKCPN